MALRRNAGIRHKSTLQSATGIQSPNLVQKSMGMSAGAFNTREFFHGATQAAMQNARVGFQLLAFAVPALLMAWGISSHSAWPWVLAVLGVAVAMGVGSFSVHAAVGENPFSRTAGWL